MTASWPCNICLPTGLSPAPEFHRQSRAGDRKRHQDVPKGQRLPVTGAFTDELVSEVYAPPARSSRRRGISSSGKASNACSTCPSLPRSRGFARHPCLYRGEARRRRGKTGMDGGQPRGRRGAAPRPHRNSRRGPPGHSAAVDAGVDADRRRTEANIPPSCLKATISWCRPRSRRRAKTPRLSRRVPDRTRPRRSRRKSPRNVQCVRRRWRSRGATTRPAARSGGAISAGLPSACPICLGDSASARSQID